MASPYQDLLDFSPSIIAIPAGIKLEAFGPEIYGKFLEKVGSQIQVISNKIDFENANRSAIRHSGLEVVENSLKDIIQYTRLGRTIHWCGRKGPRRTVQTLAHK